jgi:DNA-directed RNA polymerase specialized sigma24 family protein
VEDQQARAAWVPPDRLLLVRDWQALLARDPGQAWGALWPKLCAALRRALPESEEAADRTQALVLHWLERDAPAGWPPDVPLRVWIQGIVRLETARILRRLQRQPGAVALPRAEPPVDSVSVARLELRLDLRSLVPRLPPPYRQILAWRLAGATRRDIADLLASWRGIGPAEARRLMRRACVLIRHMLDQETRAFRALDPLKSRIEKKNPWMTSPPPHFGSLRGRRLCLGGR